MRAFRHSPSQASRVRALLWLLLAATLLLAGCATQTGISVSDPFLEQPVGEIAGDFWVGQGFSSPQANLQAIEVRLATYIRTNTEPVVFRLRRNVSDTADLATVTAPGPAIEDNRFHRFSFPPLPDSAGKSYVFILESPRSTPGNAITAWYNPTNPAPPGPLLVNGEPKRGSLSFRVRYSYPLGALLQDMLGELRRTGIFLLLALAILTIPGLALLLVVPAFRTWRRLDLLCLSPAISFALLSLGLLWVSWIVPWNSSLVRALMVLLAIVVLVQVLRARPDVLSRLRQMLREEGATILVLGVLFVLALGTRVLQIRGLGAPLGDSVHHTTIVRMILDQGGLPQNYYPYAPLSSFTYHFGFHTVVAWFVWLTGVEVKEAVLLVGQLLNALTVPTLYFLAAHLTGSRLAGLVAAAIAGLLSPMPGYYVNWGRYTQLAGQVVLPGAIVLGMAALQQRDRNKSLLFVGSLALAGLFLTHAKVFVFVVLFLGTFGVFQGLSLLRGRRWRDLGRLSLLGALVSLVFFLFVAPRVWLLWTTPITPGGPPWLTPQELDRWWQQVNITGYFWDYTSPLLLSLAAGGLFLALWKRCSLVVLVGLWTGLLVLLANLPRSLSPIGGLLSNFTVLIALYLPFSIMTGWFLAEVVRGLRWLPVRSLVGIGAGVALLWGVGYQATLLDTASQMFLLEDLPAMDWIRENTEPGSLFLINGVLAYLDQYAVETDAGAWIPVETGRQVTVPVPSLAMERSPIPDYPLQVRDFARVIYDQLYSPEGPRLLQEYGVDYIFVGKRGGPIDPQRLSELPWYDVRYNRAGVWIFQVKSEGMSPVEVAPKSLDGFIEMTQ